MTIGVRRCALPPVPPLPVFLNPESACEGFFVKKNSRCNTSADLRLHTFASADLHLHALTSADLHFHTFTFADLAHTHICWSTSSHLHICWCTSADLHLQPSHLQTYIFTSSHLQIYIFTPSHLQIYIFTPSHLLIYIFTPSHLQIYIFTPSHLLIYIFTPSHLQIYFLAVSHLQIFSLSSFLSLALLFIFLLRGGRCRRSATKRDGRSISCTSDVQNLAKIANLRCPPQPFRTKWTLILNAKNRGKIAILVGPPQPFRTKWTLDAKNCGKIAILRYPSQPFRTKWTLDVKNCGKIAILVSLPQPVRTKWMLDVKNWCKIIHRSLRNFPGGTLSYWNNFSGLILWNNLRGERGGGYHLTSGRILKWDHAAVCGKFFWNHWITFGTMSWVPSGDQSPFDIFIYFPMFFFEDFGIFWMVLALLRSAAWQIINKNMLRTVAEITQVCHKLFQHVIHPSK